MDNNIPTMADGDGVSVHSGFPNPAFERRGQTAPLALDLNRLLVRNPSSTYLFRVSGHRWDEQGLRDGDIAVVDRRAGQRPDDLVIAWQDNSLAICRQRQLAAGEAVWGTVTAVIHQYRRHP